MHRRSRAAVPLVLTALLATACHGQSHPGSTAASRSASGSSTTASTTTSAGTTTGTSSSAAASTTTAATTPAAGTSAAAPSSTARAGGAPVTSAPSSAGRSTVTAIRLSPQDTFDRVVFELGGTGTPGVNVRYVDHPTQPASGRPETVNGEGVLQVSISGTGLPADTGVREYSGPDHLATANTQAITEVVWEGQYEGTTTAFIGTNARTPFRAYLLTNPTRVVVDVTIPG